MFGAARQAAVVLVTLGAVTLNPMTASATPDVCGAVRAQFQQQGTVNPHLLVVAARSNAALLAQLAAERASLVNESLRLTTSRAAALSAEADLLTELAALSAQIVGTQNAIGTTIAELNGTGLVERAINREEAFLSTLPDGPAKDAAIAAQELARAAYDARRTALLVTLAAQRVELAAAQSQVVVDQTALAAEIAVVAAADAQLAANAARVGAIDAIVNLAGCSA